MRQSAAVEQEIGRIDIHSSLGNSMLISIITQAPGLHNLFDDIRVGKKVMRCQEKQLSKLFEAYTA